MPHLAEIVNGVVARVIVVHESYGALTPEEWASKVYGGEWRRASYNTRGGVNDAGGEAIRKNYPGPGYTYDEQRDAFIAPQPTVSSELDSVSGEWRERDDASDGAVTRER